MAMSGSGDPAFVLPSFSTSSYRESSSLCSFLPRSGFLFCQPSSYKERQERSKLCVESEHLPFCREFCGFYCWVHRYAWQILRLQTSHFNPKSVFHLNKQTRKASMVTILCQANIRQKYAIYWIVFFFGPMLLVEKLLPVARRDMNLPTMTSIYRLQRSRPKNTLLTRFRVFNKKRCTVIIGFRPRLTESYTLLWVWLIQFINLSLSVADFRYYIWTAMAVLTSYSTDNRAKVKQARSYHRKHLVHSLRSRNVSCTCLSSMQICTKLCTMNICWALRVALWQTSQNM